MPRIRTLKPQFWDSPSTAKADLAPRLLYMALWNWADDSGRGTANLKELEAFAFPNDDVTQLPRRSSGNSAASWRNFAELFWETVQAFEVTLYEVGQRRFFEISSFRVHQSKNFRPDSQLPGPQDGKKWDLAGEYGLASTIPDTLVAEVPEHSSGNSAISCRTSPLDRDEDRDGDRDGDNNPPTPHTDEPAPPATTRRTTGAEKSRRRFAAIPSNHSQLARDITQAFSDAIGTPITLKVFRDITTVVDEALQAGQQPAAIAAGIRKWGDSDSWAPSQIHAFITKAASQASATPTGDEKVNDWLATANTPTDQHQKAIQA